MYILLLHRQILMDAKWSPKVSKTNQNKKPAVPAPLGHNLLDLESSIS